MATNEHRPILKLHCIDATNILKWDGDGEYWKLVVDASTSQTIRVDKILLQGDITISAQDKAATSEKVFQVTVDDGTGTVSMLARHDLLSDFDDVLDTYTHQMRQPLYCAVLAEPLTANFNTSQPWRNMVCHRCTPVVRALHDTWVQEIQQDRLFYTNAYKIPNYDVNELKFVTYTDIT